MKTLDLASRSQLPYFERIKYCDEPPSPEGHGGPRQIVMAATGGLLTMLTQSGAGTLAGNAHADSLLALARSDAARLTEVFQRSLDKEWLNDFFPKMPHVAYFAFDMPQQEDTAKLLESVGNLSWAGYRVDKAQLEEKTGLRLIEMEQPTSGSGRSGQRFIV